LSFEIGGLSASDTTFGHKIRSPRRITVKSFREYRDALKDNMVIVDAAEREKSILDQIEALLSPLEAQLHPDPGLLERLANDVEYPFVFMGEFPERYLDLPIEILSTAMREGQKLFSVVKAKKQIPCAFRRQGIYSKTQRAGPESQARGRPVLLGTRSQNRPEETGPRPQTRPLPGETRQLRR
jgi:glycyl-tRNA synthetase beta subunit